MSFQQRKYPDLSKPRTYWEFKVEKAQVGKELKVFVESKLHSFSKADIDNVFRDRCIQLDSSPAGKELDAATVLGNQQVKIASHN
jgi:hypothetical protein